MASPAIEPLLWTLYWFLRFRAHPNDPLADKVHDQHDLFLKVWSVALSLGSIFLKT